MARLQQGTIQAATTKRIFKTEEKDIRDETKDCIESINKNWFIVYKNLYLIESGRLYEEYDYESMEHYAKEELGLEYRNMRHKVAIGKTIVSLGITTEQIEGITDWTKFKTVMPLLTEDGITSDKLNLILADAKSKTVSELKEIVAKNRVDVVGGRAVTTHSITIKLIDEQKQSYDHAMREAQIMLGGSALPGQCLEFIMLDFLSTYENKDKGILPSP
jgi:hypothetical protein